MHSEREELTENKSPKQVPSRNFSHSSLLIKIFHGILGNSILFVVIPNPSVTGSSDYIQNCFINSRST